VVSSHPPRIAIALLVGTVLVLGAAGTEAAPNKSRVVEDRTLESQQPAYFSNLRVCAYQAFSRAHGWCTRDQRARVLVSSKFACSVKFRAIRPERLHARIAYEGKPVYQYTTRILGRGPWSWWISENVGATPLPGGRWGCDFSFGSSRAGTSFRSGGPTGPVIGAAVCDAKDSLFYAHDRIRVCKTDESTRPIRATDRILCSAVFVKQVGKKGEVQLLADGMDAAKPDVATLPSPLSIWWTVFAPGTPAAGGTFAAGDYVCRFSVNGISLGEKPFQILSG
jgi:hypothetical protein